jgi:hypothetical protein
MKAYPSIPKIVDSFLGRPCISFFKYDGSSLRAEWSRKRGWYKYGTRTRLFDKSDLEYGCAIEIFHKNFAEALAKAIQDNYKCDSAIAYLEFLGPNSFAGQHKADDPKELILFDVNIYKKGLVGPGDFVRKFGHLKSAEVIYQGILTDDFVDNVRQNKYNLKEGVICKNGDGFNHTFWSCKIKTWAYLEELKKRFENWSDFWE